MNPITREEALLDGQDLTPITRKEQFIKRIYDKTQEIPEPITREEYFLKKAGEGTSPVAVEQLNVTENGTYSEAGKAYSPVNVSIPLGTKTITANGVYNASDDDLAGYSQVTVNVPLPQNAKLITTAESYPITDAANYPLPKCEVTVANADKCEVIVTNDGRIAEDSVPYLNRHSAGGNTELDEVIGGTVAWNQLVRNGNFASASDWSTIRSNVSVSDNVATITANSTDAEHYTEQTFTTIAGHIYCILAELKTDGSQWTFRTFYDGTSATRGKSYSGTAWLDIGFVINNTVSATNNRVRIVTDVEDSVANARNVNIFDLTQLFGSTIANYIYSLEEATAGAGVAYFRNLFPEDYYPYNAGELMSVKTSARKVYDSDSNLLATYSLSNIELRGIPKLVNNQLVYDGDRYEGNGRVTRKYGIRAYQSGDESLTDTITDGTNTVYKLTTSTTEQTSPYDNPQLAGSTEEFVDTREVAIPVGHESKYFNGEGYITYLEPNTSDTIDMAQEHAIMPLATTYISANGTLDVEYWK